MPDQRLTIDRNRAKLAGVCAGFADWLGWSCRRVRVAYVVLTLVSGVLPGIFAYFALYVLIPDRLIPERAKFSETN